MRENSNGSPAIFIIIWWVVGAFVHSKLWGSYDVPPEDFMPFFLIDAVVSLLICVAGLVVLTGVSLLWKKIVGE